MEDLEDEHRAHDKIMEVEHHMVDDLKEAEEHMLSQAEQKRHQERDEQARVAAHQRAFDTEEYDTTEIFNALQEEAKVRAAPAPAAATCVARRFVCQSQNRHSTFNKRTLPFADTAAWVSGLTQCRDEPRTG